MLSSSAAPVAGDALSSCRFLSCLRSERTSRFSADTAAAYYENRGYTAAGPPFAKSADSEQLYATMRKPLA